MQGTKCNKKECTSMKHRLAKLGAGSLDEFNPVLISQATTLHLSYVQPLHPLLALLLIANINIANINFITVHVAYVIVRTLK